MELAPSTQPWTATVAWARPWARSRPWHRPLPQRPMTAAVPMAPPSATSGPAVLPPEPLQESAWSEAVAELRAAREALASLDASPDPGGDAWLEALARQDLFRARRKLRRAQEALTGADADLPWSSC